jgi:hypothetical protein
MYNMNHVPALQPACTLGYNVLLLHSEADIAIVKYRYTTEHGNVPLTE